MAFTITPTTALPTTDTQVQIGATVYELNHLSAADGAALYTALGTTGTKTNYQQLADQISAIVQNYQSVVALDVPAGQDPQKYILDLLQKVKDSAGKLPDNATEEMKKVYAQLKAIPGFSNILDTTEGVTTFMGVIGDLFSGAGKGPPLSPSASRTRQKTPRTAPPIGSTATSIPSAKPKPIHSAQFTPPPSINRSTARPPKPKPNPPIGWTRPLPVSASAGIG